MILLFIDDKHDVLFLDDKHDDSALKNGGFRVCYDKSPEGNFPNVWLLALAYGRLNRNGLCMPSREVGISSFTTESSHKWMNHEKGASDFLACHAYLR